MCPTCKKLLAELAVYWGRTVKTKSIYRLDEKCKWWLDSSTNDDTMLCAGKLIDAGLWECHPDHPHLVREVTG